MENLLKYFFLILFLSSFAFGQQTLDTASSNKRWEEINEQIRKKNIPSDTTGTMPDSVSQVKQPAMTKSPLAAVLWSVALPGAGQIYVESWWKAPIFLGAAGAIAYLAFDYNKKYLDVRTQTDGINSDIDRLKKIISELPPDQNPSEYQQQLSTLQSEYTFLKSRREFYRNNRDQSFFFLAGIYILAAVDAYSGAHLYDFNVNENLSMQFYPDNTRGLVMNLSLNY